jgi:proteasome assembly chaperone (PAC2) family protein
MQPEPLILDSRPELSQGRMVLGLDGWMDGGEVSTGTLDHLIDTTEAQPFGRIDPEAFYIYSFPGSMEVAALFRPHTKIRDGRVIGYDPPQTRLHVSESDDLILAKGREPNLRWSEYIDCLLTVAEQSNTEMIYFVGSVAGLVPHTREPRISASVSDASLKPMLEQNGMHFSNYEGPASVITAMTREAGLRSIPMVAMVAEIPAYVQGRNPRAIESVVRRLSAMLGIEVRLEPLRHVSDAFEEKLQEVIEDREDLAEFIAKLEEDYDNEVFDTQMGDLKQWLESRGIRLD